MTGTTAEAEAISWRRYRCAGCGNGFTANPATVPVFDTGSGPWPCCLHCWDLRNKLRTALGMTETQRPDAYPEDYPA
jgi:hypothetical protein